MKNLLNFFFRHGKYKFALPVLAIGFALQGLLVVRYLPEFLTYSNGLKNPDQLFSYDFDYIMDLYQRLGEQGRKFYHEMLRVDFLYTLISGVGYSLLLAALMKNKKWYIILPLFLTIFDISENIAQIILMNSFPGITALGVTVSSTFSSIKMCGGLMCISLIVFFLIKNLVFWIKAKVLQP